MASDPQPAVHVRGVHKSYGSVRAVNGLDLAVPAGAAAALLGPNGSGKSTTVGMLLGLLEPDEGEITVFGLPPRRAVAQGLNGAMLQHGGYPNSARVREVINLARALYPAPLPLAEIAARTGLGDLLGRRVDRLSGGQLQRVRFAFAIAGNPRLLVLDEPTVGLDVEARGAFWSCIREYAAGDRTILFSSHYLEEADAHADLIIVLAAGRLVTEGTSAQIKKHVSTRTVAFDQDGRTADGLDRLPGVTEVTVLNGRVSLRTTDSDATVGALLSGHGRITGLELSGGGLEEAFTQLTGITAATRST
jgi:ABC-2 type transport system ATP-binding protein